MNATCLGGKLKSIPTTKFGKLNINDEDIITFPDGLVGFEKLTIFSIVDPGDNTLILWLQSLSQSNIAFPIIKPYVFDPKYSIKPFPTDLAILGLNTIDHASIYSVLTIPQEIKEISANLKAPIIINNQTKKGKQIILQNSKLEVRHKIYTQLKKNITNKRPGGSNGTNNLESTPPFSNNKNTTGKQGLLSKETII